MAVSLHELKQVIVQEFPGAAVDGVTEKGHRVFGAIVWQGFRQLDSQSRNRLVTEKVRDRLGMRGINIGYLIPVAPGEKL